MLLIRRAEGKSMEPDIHAGQVLIALRRKTLRKGQVVVFQHEGRQHVKTITKLRDNGSEIFVVGSNRAYSTDSRDYGWIKARMVVAVVIWPRLKV